VPQAAAISFLMNPTNPNGEIETRATEAAARSLGKEMLVLGASSELELDTAFAAMAQERVGALLVGSDPFFFWQRDHVAGLAARHRIPAIYDLREFAQTGGLYRQVGVYVGRILKGEKPADLPVLQSTKFELVINLKTAKALGLDIPATLLARADEVIE
jgi:putative ABC transport system substrate-binding protein